MAKVNITPQVKFSYNISQGSAEDRKNLASNINEQIFNSVTPNIKDDILELSDFETALHANLPEDKRIDIYNLEPEEEYEDGASDLIEDDFGNYIGQTIEVPSENGRVSKRPIITLFHESRHVLDVLTNPKYMARVKSMYAQDLYSKNYTNLVGEFYKDLEEPTQENKVKKLKSLKKKLNKFLKDKSIEEQVNCLQDLRYTLETERNAYADQYKFEYRLQERGVNTGDYELEDESIYYFFDEKIELVKQTLSEVITQERERHKLSLEV